MAEKYNSLFKEFPPVSTNDWQALIEADLKGRDFEKTLVWKTNEGFTVRPYYRQEDLENIQYLNQLPGQFPYTRGTKSEGNDWLIRQDIIVSDFEAANTKALEILQKGVNSLGFIFKSCPGISRNDLNTLLKDISLEAIELNLVVCSKKTQNAKVLAQYITEHYGANSKVKASVSIDPIGTFSKNGAISEESFAELNSLLAATSSLQNLSIINVNGKIYRDAGSSIVQELAFSLASGAEYLTKLSDLGADLANVAKKMKFNFGVGANYFLEIAKLRAARLLWAKIVEAYEPKCDCCDDCSCEEECADGICRCAAKMLIHSENTIFNKTVYDPHVNLLRTQTEAMSAVLGGCNSLTILPFNAVYEASTTFSERIARNQQILLKEEAHFDKIADPAAGSYYIEKLTDSIIDETWKLFLEVQEKGGYIAAFKAGFIQSSVEATASKLENAVATRRENILGTNQFPNSNEYIQREINTEVFAKDERKSENAIANPLKRFRGAQAFETLRYATDVYSKNNKRPLVFLLTIGNLVMRKARAQFASNFFAVAGFEVMEGKGYQTAEEGVVDAVEAGAQMVVICSSDEEYAEFAPAVAEMLSDEQFVVAGLPECKSALEAKGITNFIHVRSNLLEELKSYQLQLIK
ncbi:MAG: methylmalonyl-CoA mutase family protein [Prolixibacteraceae bacterium]